MRAALLTIACAACGSTSPAESTTTTGTPAPDAALAAAVPTAAQADTVDRVAEAYLALTVDSIVPAPPLDLATIAWSAVGGGASLRFEDDPLTNAANMRAAAATVDVGTEWSAIATMAASRADAHAVLLESEQLGNIMAWATGRPYAGPGLFAHRDAAGAVVVSEVIADGPAAAAGLLPGDTIVAIDGAPPPPAVILPMLSRPAGTRVALEIDRAGVRSTIGFALTSQAFPLVTSRVSKKAAIIRVYAVVVSDDPARDVATLVRAAIAKLNARKVRGIVLDLRGCPGGEGVTALASIFIGNDPILLRRNVAGVDEPWPRQGARAEWFHPVVVLVDDQTGSAAEMVALALHDQGAIRVIGQPTFGEMSVPGVLDFGEGHWLVYPAELVLGPRAGKLPRGGRLEPDILIDNRTAADILAGTDKQLAAAIKAATGKSR